MKPLAVHSERGWILLGMAESCAEEGYEATSVAGVCAAAGVSEERFAQLFESREECLGATMEWLVGLARERLETNAPTGAPWAERLRNGVAALLEMSAERPAFARLVLLEARTAGGRAAILHDAAKAGLLAFLEQGETLAGEAIPANAGRGAMAGVEALLTCRVLAGEAERLGELRGEVTFMLAVPYLGRREATRLSETSQARGHLRAVA